MLKSEHASKPEMIHDIGKSSHKNKNTRQNYQGYWRSVSTCHLCHKVKQMRIFSALSEKCKDVNAVQNTKSGCARYLIV